MKTDFTEYVRFRIDKDLKEKVDKMRENGINISQILRNFLKDYQLLRK